MAFKNPGVQALFITNLFSNVIRLGSNLLLARMLSPEAFAITGLAMTVIFTFNMLSDGGFKAFILRHEEGESDKLLSTLWTVKLFRDIVLAIILFFSSDTIAVFFGIPEMSLVLKVLCLNFLFEGIKPMTDLLAERRNKVATVMYLHFGCYIFSTLVTLVGVYFYRSYWAIIVGMISNMAFMAISGYLFLGANGAYISLDRKICKEFLAWAKFIIPSSIITLLLMQLDKIILGRALSVTELGLYYVAFNFSAASLTLVIQYARKVMEPYMASVYRDDPSAYADKYYAFRMKLSLLMAFAVGLLSGCSYIFFDILYDDRYVSASYYLSILLIAPVFALISYPSELCLILHGLVRMTLISNIIRLLWFILAAFTAYHFFGVFGLLLAIGLVDLPSIMYMFYKMNHMKILTFYKEVLIVISALAGFSSGYVISVYYNG